MANFGCHQGAPQIQVQPCQDVGAPWLNSRAVKDEDKIRHSFWHGIERAFITDHEEFGSVGIVGR